MPMRRSRGKLYVVSGPQTRRAEGRRAPLARVTSPRLGAGQEGDLAERSPAHRRDGQARRAARAAGDVEGERRAARREKTSATTWCTGGRAEIARAVTQAFTGQGGALLRMVAASHADIRAAMLGAAHRFVEIRHEHGVSSSAADAALLRACVADAFAVAVAERLAAHGLGEGAADLARMYTQLGAASRLDTMSALQAANLAPDPGSPCAIGRACGCRRAPRGGTGSERRLRPRRGRRREPPAVPRGCPRWGRRRSDAPE